MEKIRDDMRGVKVSVIIDESPDITGVPTINTLLCYYSQKNVKKHVVLVDVDRVNASNSYTVASAVSKALLTVGKTWKDVVAVATDSAKYMRKMVREICQAEGIQILHVKDIAHLIHVSVDHAISLPCMSDVRSVVIKFGALFKHANKLYQKYTEICSSNGLFGPDIKKPPSVVPNRWQSFYKALVVVVEMWSSLTELAESSHDSSKAEAIREILFEKEVVYAKEILMRDALGPLLEAQKTLESGKLLMPSFDHLVNVKLQQIVGELSAMIGKSDQAKAVLSMLPKRSANLVKTCSEEFCTKLATKWRCTLGRNVSEKEENQLTLWKLGAVLDPFQKRLLGQSFEDYRPLLMSVTDNVDSLNEEFNQYLLEASPTNPADELIEYCVAGFRLVNLAKVLPPNSAMDKKTYKRTMSTLQARIQRLEENLENSRIEGAQKNAMLKELLELCAEKDDQLRRDAEEVNEIRREFEELKRLHARSQRGCVSCVIM
ncbi:hypothetical protein HPB51_010942 [Rhipicephalus microplus]|uniref:DUF659 domain-containing protein n=1 Tax=Rhipicephalus microplus TaxID=6941 RepID=A0A9J6D514_RHIMP|nr:hypothetical protein HPB51_010942 [Rhipicephalus microplus]